MPLSHKKPRAHPRIQTRRATGTVPKRPNKIVSNLFTRRCTLAANLGASDTVCVRNTCATHTQSPELLPRANLQRSHPSPLNTVRKLHERNIFAPHQSTTTPSEMFNEHNRATIEVSNMTDQQANREPVSQRANRAVSAIAYDNDRTMATHEFRKPSLA